MKFNWEKLKITKKEDYRGILNEAINLGLNVHREIEKITIAPNCCITVFNWDW